MTCLIFTELGFRQAQLYELSLTQIARLVAVAQLC